MQHDVVRAVHAAIRLLPCGGRQVSVGRLLRTERQDDRKDRGYRITGQCGGRLIAGGGRIGGDPVGLDPARKRPVPQYRFSHNGFAAVIHHRKHATQRVGGMPNAVNSVGSRNTVIASIRSPPVPRTCIEWARMTPSAVRRYSATAGCPFAPVGIIATSPAVVNARAARNRITASRPVNHIAKGGISSLTSACRSSVRAATSPFSNAAQ